MTESLLLAGSTGSIGTQALNVCKKHKIKINGLSAGNNYKLLAQQALEFSVKNIHISNEKHYKDLKALLPSGTNVYSGDNGLIEMIEADESDTFFNSVMGSAGLMPTITAIQNRKKIALANKETIVCGGDIVMNEAEKYGVGIYPVDSEHSAIFQCLQAGRDKDVKKIILTASGGPFFGRKTLKNISLSEALNHPNWSMGKKITVDSATLMNKGLEVIEAHHLFGHKPVSVVVHRESIVHSMVEFNDNAIVAQLGTPDMAIPIQYALTYPKRPSSLAQPVDFEKLSSLTFHKPDTEVFISLQLAYDALKAGGTAPCVLNGANEAAVEGFLNGKIEFHRIPEITEKVLRSHTPVINYNLDDLREYDKESRIKAEELF